MNQHEIRVRVQLLWELGKQTPKEIKEILNVSLATVYITINRMKNNIPFEHQSCRGRKPTKSNAIMNSLRQQIRLTSGATSLDEMNTKVVERTGVVCSKVMSGEHSKDSNTPKYFLV